MVGHPLSGEVFRVQKAGTSTVSLALASSANWLTTPSSLTYTSLQHATYEVQALVFTYATTPLTSPIGYRLRFRSYTTYSTLAGGDYGCLTTASTASDVRTELLKLLSIDEVLVSKSQANSTGVTYLVTFTGSLVRGDVPPIDIIDTGANGCTVGSPPNNVGTQTISGSTHGAVSSYVPVYRLETTAALAYNAPAAHIKDALEALDLVRRRRSTMDLDKTGQFLHHPCYSHSFTHLYSFSSPQVTLFLPPPPLFLPSHHFFLLFCSLFSFFLSFIL